jgi:hypothetical protein
MKPIPTTKPTRRSLLLTALFFIIGLTRPRATAAAKELLMMSRDSTNRDDTNQDDRGFGKLNTHAPAALAKFAFLIGNWKCEANLQSASGDWQKFPATWQGRFILDGYAIEDEYRMTGASGELIVLGMNLRTYDAANNIWSIKWLNALAGNWTDLASPEFGGVNFDNQSVTYAFKEPTAAHPYTRATYTNISKQHFTWRGEKSTDAKSWTEFMIVECRRS